MQTYFVGKERIQRFKTELDPLALSFFEAALFGIAASDELLEEQEHYEHDAELYRQVKAQYDEMIDILMHADFYRSSRAVEELKTYIQEEIVPDLARVEVELEALLKRYPDPAKRLRRVEEKLAEIEAQHAELDAAADEKFLEMLQIQDHMETLGVTDDTLSDSMLASWYRRVTDSDTKGFTLDSLTDDDWQQLIVGPAISTLNWLLETYPHEMVEIRLNSSVQTLLEQLLRSLRADGTDRVSEIVALQHSVDDIPEEELTTIVERPGFDETLFRNYLTTLMLVSKLNRRHVHVALAGMRLYSDADIFLIDMFDALLPSLSQIGVFPPDALRRAEDICYFAMNSYVEQGQMEPIDIDAHLEYLRELALIDFVNRVLERQLDWFGIASEDVELVMLVAWHWVAKVVAKHSEQLAQPQ